jgi:hypothetical protein
MSVLGRTVSDFHTRLQKIFNFPPKLVFPGVKVEKATGNSPAKLRPRSGVGEMKKAVLRERPGHPSMSF